MSSQPGIMADAMRMSSTKCGATPRRRVGGAGSLGGLRRRSPPGRHIGAGTLPGAGAGAAPPGPAAAPGGRAARQGRPGGGSEAPRGDRVRIRHGRGSIERGRARRGPAGADARRDGRDRGPEGVRAEAARRDRGGAGGRRGHHAHGRHPRPLGRGLGVRPGEVGTGREILDVVAHVFARRQSHARVLDLAARGREQAEHGRPGEERQAPAARPPRRPRARGQHRYHPPWLSAAAGSPATVGEFHPGRRPPRRRPPGAMVGVSSQAWNRHGGRIKANDSGDSGGKCRLTSSRPGLPILDHQSRNPGELADIVRDQDQTSGQGDRGDHQVVRADHLPG